ncbi:uridine diphosphate-N-acetylglucosamine-binding protein YvcK [Amycolatopsis sp.]|uniref:gluconeogenesis factor YvcK family protein n=1 Tax=Amycolatopsis sp. TaxID=37632 RepID=UPI002BEB0695|nr:uridine diphosphate-N-acetylglucosamine-binding protein YvcK [Amycolatopsis sp.]HVV13080.1 uridine diphosphate-N-acetylglucosamine-binding protein YvcK [Amycolatopsis sp.]
MRAVALGGGHGLHATLMAARRLTSDVTAVVTVADDGGSSGRLRRELGLLPPGDLRQALATLAEAELGETLWGEVFQHRFGGNGALAGHAVGNLLLAGLFEVLGDPVAALDEACRLLGVSGRVLPMATGPLEIEGEVTGLSNDGEVRTIRGQVAVASTPGRVRRIELRTPGSPGATPVACPQAVDAVLGADVVFLGPGSWFTSVLPHVLVPGLHDALVRTEATKVVILNLVPQPGETAGFSPERHLHVLFQHAPGLRVDTVIADRASVPTPQRLSDAAAELGARALLADVADPNVAGLHDPDALAGCVREALGRRPGAGDRDGGESREGTWR